MQTKHTYQLTDEQVQQLIRLVRKAFDECPPLDLETPEQCILIAHALHQTDAAIQMAKDYLIPQP